MDEVYFQEDSLVSQRMAFRRKLSDSNRPLVNREVVIIMRITPVPESPRLQSGMNGPFGLSVRGFASDNPEMPRI